MSDQVADQGGTACLISELTRVGTAAAQAQALGNPTISARINTIPIT